MSDPPRLKPKASTTVESEHVCVCILLPAAARAELLEALLYLQRAKSGHLVFRLDHYDGKGLRPRVDVTRESS